MELAAERPIATKAPLTYGVTFLLGLSSLWFLFWAGFVFWWWLMSLLFQQGRYPQAVGAAYGLPILYVLAAYLGSKVPGSSILKLLHFLSFFVMALALGLILAAWGQPPPQNEFPAYLGMGFIAFVMALMQYPKAGLKGYEAYKTSLFLGGVIFMPLFIYFAAMLPNVPHTPALDKAVLFPIGMAGFWLSGAWLASRRTQGSYVPGLAIRPLMPFRPDFILPGGVLFVKGVIMMGVGLMMAIHPMLGMPQWNWWGFALAFWGIITLIPLRGMYKMVKGRRARMLGLGGTGFAHELAKGFILFIGLNIMLYGFVNAFMGPVPFTMLGATREFNSILLVNWATLIGVTTYVFSFIVLVLLRGWYKMKLLEGAESFWQLLTKQVLLYIGVWSLLVAFIHILYLPPIKGTGYMNFYPSANPVGFSVGILLLVAGSFLILVLRPLALKNELQAMVSTMVGAISDAGEEVRRWVMTNRLRALAAMPSAQRDEHVKWMLAGLGRLPQEKREAMMKTQIEILSELDPVRRRLMMASMDKAMLGRS